MTVQETLQQAFVHHRAGQLAEAEALYRRAIEQQPNHPDAWHLLGMLAFDAGQRQKAADIVRQAIALNPNVPDYHHNLGFILLADGRAVEAAEHFRTTLRIKPDHADAHFNLGKACVAMKQLEQATACYRAAIQLRPNFAAAHNNLGNLLTETRAFEPAIACYRDAIRSSPTLIEAHLNLAGAFREIGRLDQATEAYRAALRLKPAASISAAIGTALLLMQRFDDAVEALTESIQRQPENPDAHNDLGSALRAQGHLKAAIESYRRALALKPDFAEAHNNLAGALRNAGQTEPAIASYRAAIEHNPQIPVFHSNLGAALADHGEVGLALDSLRAALSLEPNNAAAHSNLAYLMHFDPNCDAQGILLENRRWDARQAARFRDAIRPHGNDRDPNRRLRIGYISPDLRDHVVGWNLLPLFKHHDRSEFEIFTYTNFPRTDAVSEQFRAISDRWRPIAVMNDEQAAEVVREDQIDILVDLALHMVGNRLLVLARKPAPVQATFAGYPGTTGLATIDYRLTDPRLDPEGSNDSYYSERPIRLPHSFWCYEARPDGPAVSSLPAVHNGHVTFGCLNNFCKVNDVALALWKQVLDGLPNSRLLLAAPDGGPRQRVIEMLGIDPARIEFVGRLPHAQYMATYHRIDIALDTFPYNGHTTSLDAMWMGVPTVSLAGATAVSRAGLSQSTQLGLDSLVTSDPARFARIALDLASDLPRLREIRATLRDRMNASSLMDARGFARGIEQAYRSMWRRWCGVDTVAP